MASPLKSSRWFAVRVVGNLQRLHQQLRKGPAVVFGHAALGRDANEVGPNQGETSGDGKMPGQLAELQDILH